MNILSLLKKLLTGNLSPAHSTCSRRTETGQLRDRFLFTKGEVGVHKGVHHSFEIH